MSTTFTMSTLEYFWDDGSHTIFDDYTIDENSVVTNIKTGHVMSQYKNKSGYSNVAVSHNGTRRGILVGRALASTFIGPPPTLLHTTDHKVESFQKRRYKVISTFSRNSDDLI